MLLLFDHHILILICQIYVHFSIHYTSQISSGLSFNESKKRFRDTVYYISEQLFLKAPTSLDLYIDKIGTSRSKCIQTKTEASTSTVLK